MTSTAVLLEIGSALSRVSHRGAATVLLSVLQRDPNVSIVSLSDALLSRSFTLFSNRPDKEWSWVDCISFIIMGDYELTEALTADHHFSQAGFTVVLD